MVNYPHNLIRQKVSSVQKQTKQNKVDFANRGMSFEAAINATNDYYLSRQIAVIHKNLLLSKLSKLITLSAVGQKSLKHTLDKLQRLTIAAFIKDIMLILKQKKPGKNSYAHENFHLHQIEHMACVLHQKGICFVLLHFSTLKETYYLPAQALISFYQIDNGSKSMPIDYIRKNGFKVAFGAFPQVPYLNIIEQNFLGGDYN